jgi:hypothetical protein
MIDVRDDGEIADELPIHFYTGIAVMMKL